MTDARLLLCLHRAQPLDLGWFGPDQALRCWPRRCFRWGCGCASLRDRAHLSQVSARRAEGVPALLCPIPFLPLLGAPQKTLFRIKAEAQGAALGVWLYEEHANQPVCCCRLESNLVFSGEGEIVPEICRVQSDYVEKSSLLAVDRRTGIERSQAVINTLFSC